MLLSRVKEWLRGVRRGLSVAAGFPIAVPQYPHHDPFTIPFPSHRTFSFPESGGPTVFVPRHAQALARVLDDSAPDVDHASGVQSPIRVFPPPEASTFMAKVQVAAKASVDEALQASERVARVGMA